MKCRKRFEPAISDSEIPARIALLAPLKERWRHEIPMEIIDRLLDPVPCPRTSLRLKRLTERTS